MDNNPSSANNGNVPSNSTVDKFFGSLIELSKKLDSEVSVLESRVKSQVVRAVTSTDGEFAAPIADDINDDLNNLNRMLDEKLKFVHEQSAIMDSFIDNSLQTIEATRQDVLKVQEYAANYGYKPTDEAKFQELTREDLELKAQVNENSSQMLQNSTTTDLSQSTTGNEVSDNNDNIKFDDEKTIAQETGVSHPSITSKDQKNKCNIPDVQPGTPKLLEIGLSKTTLRQFGYTFKDDGDHQRKEKGQQNRIHNPINEEKSVPISPEDSPISILKNTLADNSKVQSNTYAGEETNFTDEPSITSDISILHANIPNVSNTTMELSRIEISPGLVVKRPSSKTKQKTVKESVEGLQQKNYLEENKGAVDASPTLVYPCTPVKHASEESCNAINESINGSPVMPTFQTIDVKKFLDDLKGKERPSCLDKTSTVPEDTPDKQLVDDSKSILPRIVCDTHKTGISNQDNTASPELPVLKTIDLGKYLSNYNSGQPSAKSKESFKQFGQDNTPEMSTNASNVENKTPDFPELTSLTPRSLHAMSVKKSNADDTPNFEKLEDVIANEVSPACPVLSKSTMNLIKFNP